MLATCPRSSLPPILLGLAITIQHKYGHRSLGDLLNKFGFASSYTETSTFIRVAAGTQGVALEPNDNVHESKVVGEAIVMRTANKSVKDHSFKQADQVINLISKLCVSVGREKV